MVGLMLDSMSRNSGFGLQIAWFGLILFAATAVFALITLLSNTTPATAPKLVVHQRVLYPQEMKGIIAVLDAAALTYVAGAVQAISTVLYYLFLILGRRRD